MANFPALRTGAVAQYPLERQTRYRTDICNFLNNSEQVYVDLATRRRAWVINLSLLSSREVSTLRTFFEDQQGRFGLFTFTDPYDGTVFTDKCSFLEDEFPLEHGEETQFEVMLTVYQRVP